MLGAGDRGGLVDVLLDDGESGRPGGRAALQQLHELPRRTSLDRLGQRRHHRPRLGRPLRGLPVPEMPTSSQARVHLRSKHRQTDGPAAANRTARAISFGHGPATDPPGGRRRRHSLCSCHRAGRAMRQLSDERPWRNRVDRSDALRELGRRPRSTATGISVRAMKRCIGASAAVCVAVLLGGCGAEPVRSQAGQVSAQSEATAAIIEHYRGEIPRLRCESTLARRVALPSSPG